MDQSKPHAELSVKGVRASDSLEGVYTAKLQGRGHDKAIKVRGIIPIDNGKIKGICSLMMWLSC